MDHIIRHYLLLLTSIEQAYSIICLTVFEMLCPYSFRWHAQLLETVSFKGEFPRQMFLYKFDTLADSSRPFKTLQDTERLMGLYV